MSLFRLFALLLLIPVSVATVAAQSQSTDPVPLSSSVTNSFSSQLSQFGVPHCLVA